MRLAGPMAIREKLELRGRALNLSPRIWVYSGATTLTAWRDTPNAPSSLPTRLIDVHLTFGFHCRARSRYGNISLPAGVPDKAAQ